MVKVVKKTFNLDPKERDRLRKIYESKFNEIKKILSGIEKECLSGSAKKIGNLYNLLTKEAIYVQGLGNIKSNKGMATKGTDDETLNGMNLERISKICNEMKLRTFKFSPFRRVFIPKPGKKVLLASQPLGIPNFRDRLVQSAIKIILETIYEPEFERINLNYGFRPNKSCHDVIKKIKFNATGCRYALEGDIVGAYDNVNIKILIKILSKRISDNRFLGLIEQGCHCGLLEMGVFKNTLVGVPQGGIASPILFNIYMHEFDLFINTDLQKKIYLLNVAEGRVDHPIDPRWQKANQAVFNAKTRVKNYLNRWKGVRSIRSFGSLKDKLQLNSLLELKKNVNMTRLKFPNTIVSKKKVRILFYRYADDWILLSNCKKEYLLELKEVISEWLGKSLK